jgi:hypothetical protein
MLAPVMSIHMWLSSMLRDTERITKSGYHSTSSWVGLWEETR